MKDYFVDFNDLRVSRPEEIMETIGQNNDSVINLADLLKSILGAIFSKYNTVSLEFLRKLGKRQAKEILEKIDGVSSFVLDYCMLVALGAHTIPLTHKMVQYLRSKGLVYADSDERDISGFLLRQVAAKNAYEFYALIRRASERRTLKQKKKTKTKKK